MLKSGHDTPLYREQRDSVTEGGEMLHDGPWLHLHRGRHCDRISAAQVQVQYARNDGRGYTIPGHLR